MGYRIVNGRAYAVGNFFNLESESKLTNGNTGEVSFNDVLNNIKTFNPPHPEQKHKKLKKGGLGASPHAG